MNTPARCSGILLLLCLTLFPFANEPELSLPIRIIDNARDPSELNIHDIHLLINGTPRKITHLVRKERSLSRVPDLGRHFIFSFHNTKGSTPIENAIAYFISEILGPRDSLLLLSPLKAYRILVTPDKQKMTMEICRILKKDGALHEKNRISAEKRLESDLHRLNTIASSPLAAVSPEGTRDSEQVLSQATNSATNYKAIYQVLLNFPQSFSRYKNQYLLPDIIRHQKIKDLLEKNEGENWWIHFQHREDVQIVQKARSTAEKLNAYIGTHESGTLARTMQKSLSDFEKQLLISESFPQAEILDTLLGKNMSFNVIHWGSLKSDESGTSSEESSDLGAVLRRIAEYSGGKNIVATDPEQGIKEIKNHADVYYELAFAFDGKVEEKKIQISTNRPNPELSYKQRFSAEDMDQWVRTVTKKKVKIHDIAIHNDTIHFEIDSFEKNKEKQFGLLKVRISLFDGNNNKAYKSENTLRASKQRVTLSIPIPPEHHGKFRLVIEVFDFLANTSACSEQSIEIYR